MGFGGAIGAVARYVIFRWLGFSISGFPVGTFLVNMLGCLLIGICWAILSEEKQFLPRLFFITGILGGFTTFSSFSWESFQLIQDGKLKLAFFYIFSSNLAGLVLLALGYLIVKRLQL